MQDIVSLDELFFENLVNTYAKGDYDELQKLWTIFISSDIDNENKKSMLEKHTLEKISKIGITEFKNIYLLEWFFDSYLKYMKRKMNDDKLYDLFCAYCHKYNIENAKWLYNKFNINIRNNNDALYKSYKNKIFDKNAFVIIKWLQSLYPKEYNICYIVSSYNGIYSEVLQGLSVGEK